MLRLIGAIVVAFGLFLPATSVDLYAQRGGRGGGGVVRSGPGSAFVGRAAPIIPPVVSPVARFPRNSFSPRNSFFPNIRQRTVIVPQPFGFYPGFSPYSPYFWSSPFAAGPVYSEPTYASPDVVSQAPAASSNDVELSYQVGRLSEQIEQLRQEQAQRSAPAPATTSGIPTALIYRDGHRVDIQNYAIVGDTLWVLDEKSSMKVALADLDLDATQKENRGRGLRFPLPAR